MSIYNDALHENFFNDEYDIIESIEIKTSEDLENDTCAFFSMSLDELN